MAFPDLVSVSDSHTPLTQKLVHRSTRLSTGKEGFCSVRIEKEPSNRKGVNDERGEIRPLSISTLQGWGIKCGVDPSDLTEDALLQAPPLHVYDDETEE